VIEGVGSEMEEASETEIMKAARKAKGLKNQAAPFKPITIPACVATSNLHVCGLLRFFNKASS
jgi:hypothetical protein